MLVASQGMISCGQLGRPSEQLVELQQDDKHSVQRQLRYLSREIASSPRNPEYYFLRSRLYVQDANLKAALQDIDRALQLDGQQGEYHLQRAEILFLQMSYEGALKNIAKARALGVEDPRLQGLQGACLFEAGKDSSALAQLLPTYRVFPDNPRWQYYLGATYSALRDTAHATRYLRQAIGSQPSDYKPYWQLMRLYNRAEQPSKALAYGHQGIKQAKEHAPLDFEMAMAMEQLKAYDSAIYWHKRTLVLDANHWRAHRQLGLFLRYGQPAQAVHHFREALRLQPGQADLYVELGSYEENQQKDYTRAQELYRQALSLDTALLAAKKGMARVESRLRWEAFIKANPGWYAAHRDSIARAQAAQAQ